MTLLYNLEAQTAVHTWCEVAGSLTSWGSTCVLWLVGQSGIGKASLVKAWAKEHDWELSVLSADTHHNAKEVIDQMGKICNTQSFVSAFEGNTPTRAIMIDDLDVFASVDRGFFGAFTECFKYSHWRAAPCICIVTNAFEKRVRDLKKGMVISMPAPSATEIATWHGSTKKPSHAMIAECNGNMSYLKLLQESGNPGQTMDRAYGAQCFFEYPPLPLEMLRRVMLDDPWFHPLRIHENFIGELAKRRGTIPIKNRTYQSFLDVLIAWDAIIGPSGSISSSNETDMATEIMSHAVKHYLGAMKPLKAATVDTSGNAMSFTKLLSHLSLQKKHRREQYEATPFGFPCAFFL